MSHTHVGGKQAMKKRLKRTEHRAVVLERRRRISKARILEMIKHYHPAIIWLDQNGLFRHNPKESLKSLIHRGVIAIHGIRDKVLRHHAEQVFSFRTAHLRAEEKAARTVKRIAELKARNPKKAMK